MRHLVLGIAVAVTSLMPVVGMADDQQIAEYVKSRLKAEQDAGNLKGFNVDMRVDGGTVWFEGFVSSPKQQMTILRTAQQAGHLGVIQVVDDIEVKNASPYRARCCLPVASADGSTSQLSNAVCCSSTNACSRCRTCSSSRSCTSSAVH